MTYSTEYHFGHQAGQKDAYHQIFDSMMGFALDRFDTIMHETFTVNNRVDDAADDIESKISDVVSELDDIKAEISELKSTINALNDNIIDHRHEEE